MLQVRMAIILLQKRRDGRVAELYVDSKSVQKNWQEQLIERERAGEDALLSHLNDCLGAIDEKNKELNALLFIENRDVLKNEASVISQRIRDKKAGKLAGMIIAVKANINVQGWPISCASRVLEDYYGTYNADVVVKLKEEDALIIGIANCDEFASGSSGKHSAFGPSKNPYDTSRISGGSSSGSAVAVSSGMVDAALGSDTGGSIRNPASHCNVIGIKPSYGRVSRFGLVDLSMSLDQIGPFARDVGTAAKIMSVISVYSKNDATTFNENSADYSSIEDKSDSKKLRIAALDLSELNVSSEVISVYNETLESLRERFEIKEVMIPNISLSVATYYPLVYTEFFSATRKLDGRRFGKKIEDYCGVEVLRRIIAGSIISSEEDTNRFYRKSLAIKNSVTDSFRKAFEDIDIILLPVVPVTARKIDENVLPEDEYAEDALTIPASLSGICAASYPVGFSKGLPVGLQVYAKHMGEENLFSMLFELEKMFGEEKIEK